MSCISEQSHSGGNLVDPTLQDNVLLLDDFRRVHQAHRERSRHALEHPGLTDPRRKKPQKGQAISVFHSRELDVRKKRSGRSSIRSGSTQNRSVHKYLESSPKYSMLVQFEARSKKRIAVVSNTIPRNRSLNTLFATCIGKVVYMMTEEELYHKVHLSPRLPRVVLTPILQYGRQDPPNREARKSTDQHIEQNVVACAARSLHRTLVSLIMLSGFALAVKFASFHCRICLQRRAHGQWGCVSCDGCLCTDDSHSPGTKGT